MWAGFPQEISIITEPDLSFLGKDILDLLLSDKYDRADL